MVSDCWIFELDHGGGGLVRPRGTMDGNFSSFQPLQPFGFGTGNGTFDMAVPDR